MEKTKISAEIIADSINTNGNRITSFILKFPRIILAELNTHRALSRNSASSRAIPFKTMVQRCIDDPFTPMAFQKDHKGMQGTEYFTEEDHKVELAGGGYHSDLDKLRNRWLISRDGAVMHAKALNETGLTKQLCNRPLETYMWHTAIVTATDLENFFHLRCPQYEFFGETFRSKEDIYNRFSQELLLDNNCPNRDDAVGWLKLNSGAGEIHIMELAEKMWDAVNNSTPNQLENGEWHVPFGDRLDGERLGELANGLGLLSEGGNDDEGCEMLKIKIATARCARVSYLNYEGKDDYEADIKLHDRLSSMGHWSPFEHCAQATDGVRSGNFFGFTQYRKMFVNENVTVDND